MIAVRSVQLTTDTAEAWKGGGVQFSRRGRTADEVMNLGHTDVLNLGKSDFDTDHRYDENQWLWNAGNDIKPLIYPGMSRELLGDLMPPHPVEFPADVWIKQPGAHGRGKHRMTVDEALVMPRQWDWCQHLEGQEYRVVTVGHRVVQDFLRHGDNGSRSYEWTPMREVPDNIKAAARGAARLIPGHNVIAWDMILTPQGEAFIFEGNTCPGVNSDTVIRIRTEMERQHNA